MKQIAMFAIIAVSVAALGCAGIGGVGGAGHATGGSIMTNSTYASVDTTSTIYQLEKKDFKVLGPVSGEATSTSILGWIESGNAGYYTLLEKAREGKNADDVIDVRIDNQYSNILGLFAKVTTKLHGIAVKWN